MGSGLHDNRQTGTQPPVHGATANFDPTTLRSRALREAYGYWDAKRGDRAMPARADLEPSEMRAWLAHVLLVDVLYGPDGAVNDFRFRLVGTDVVERYGREFTGNSLSSLDLDGKSPLIHAEYCRTVERRRPQYFIDEFVQNSGRPMHYERLLMPLSDDGETINMLFGVQKSLFDDGHD
jgi:hypothetical protein